MVWSGVGAAAQPAPSPAEMLDALKGFAVLRADSGLDYLYNGFLVYAVNMNSATRHAKRMNIQVA